MKWLNSYCGQKKVDRFFAIFPVSDGIETRWLEWVTVEKEFDGYEWKIFRFIDEQKDNNG